MKRLKILTNLSLGIIIIITFLFLNCNGKKEQKGSKSSIKFQVEIVSRSDATVYTLFPVQIQSESDIEIYPRATGYIQKIYVREGDNHLAQFQKNIATGIYDTV